MNDGYQNGEVLWPISTAAKYLCLHRKTLERHIRAGTLFLPERIVRIGSRIRIPREEVFRVASGIIRTIKNNSTNNLPHVPR
jgi:excisionase family DNA binding protein